MKQAIICLCKSRSNLFLEPTSTIISNKSKVSCSKKQLGPLMGLELMTDRYPSSQRRYPLRHAASCIQLHAVFVNLKILQLSLHNESLSLSEFLIFESFSYSQIVFLPFNLFLIFESFPYLWILSLSLNLFLIFESFPHLWILSSSLNPSLIFEYFHCLWIFFLPFFFFLSMKLFHIFDCFSYLCIFSLCLNLFLISNCVFILWQKVKLWILVFSGLATRDILQL